MPLPFQFHPPIGQTGRKKRIFNLNPEEACTRVPPEFPGISIRRRTSLPATHMHDTESGQVRFPPISLSHVNVSMPVTTAPTYMGSDNQAIRGSSSARNSRSETGNDAFLKPGRRFFVLVSSPSRGQPRLMYCIPNTDRNPSMLRWSRL